MIIFAQLFMTMAGAMDGQICAGLFLSFYLARLVQFFTGPIKAIEMYQSNMMCVVLAAIACKNTIGINALSTASAVFMILDAYIGLVLFAVKKNIHVTMFEGQFSQAGKAMRRIRLNDLNDSSE
jgi:cytochrome c-type biogenesis protein CcmE